jgi:hypothetical protein
MHWTRDCASVSFEHHWPAPVMSIVMRSPMREQIPDRKPQVVELLQLLASEDRQLAYERNVPHVDITAELLCMWFNDTYHPGDKFFASWFTEGERAALAQFHTFYEARSRRLPESQGTVRTWLASPMWREIMEEASKTLEKITA